MGKQLEDYSGRCGSCLHYELSPVGKSQCTGICKTAPTNMYMHNNRHGNRYIAQHSQRRTSSNKACSRYINKNITEAEWMCELMCNSVEED